MIVLVISLICFIGCVAFFILSRMQSNEIDDLRSQASVDTDDVSSGSNYVEPPVNFVELKKKNPDIYAWINIPGTVVDYPILRRDGDNGYYLNHTAEGKTSIYGSIYTEDYNDKDFADFNTVIYGHNMKNGTMFGSLKKYRDKAFFEQNCYINIYMPGRIMKYQIFAAYVWDDRHILLSLDFSKEDIRSAYLDMIFSTRKMNANINQELTVTEEDRIITLSTCTSNKEERFLVQGVLIYDSREQN
ncbi:MAG: class B sortase [Acutalibacteraceae bacterium]